MFTMNTERSHDEHTRPAPAGETVQSVDRAVRLLKAVSSSAEPVTIWELARRCNLNRTTVWRLLSTLELHGLVERNPDTQRYGVGYEAIQIAAAADYDGLARRVRPMLERTAAATGESVTLAAAHRFTLVYVDQADPPTVPAANWIGRSLPLHATSSGKVFLAWLPEAERDAVLPPHLEAYTNRTITDRALLDQELAEIRVRGYSTCMGELEDHSNGVSAAVLNRMKRPVVVVNIWGSAGRVTSARIPTLGRTVLSLAHEISLAHE
jgi:DNA-binding IclR family transcriptional regulator